MIRVGAKCAIERRLGWDHTAVDHRWIDTIQRLTKKRAYFANNHWFAIDDPKREVKPKYLDYTTVVTDVDMLPATVRAEDRQSQENGGKTDG